MEATPHQLITPAEAAQMLCVSVKQLTHLTHAGEIKYINVGLGRERERRRYHPDDIEEFISRRSKYGGSQQAPRPTYFRVLDIAEIRASLKRPWEEEIAEPFRTLPKANFLGRACC